MGGHYTRLAFPKLSLQGERVMPIDEKPRRNEDEYWAKVDAELIKSRRAALDAEREQARKSEQQNKCPRCCVDLKEREYHHVKID